MAISDEIIRVLDENNGSMPWKDLLNTLIDEGYKKESIYMAKKRLIDRGVISEKEDFDGEIIISLRDTETQANKSINSFDEEFFLAYYEYKIKEYFKHKLSVEGPEWDIFDVREFVTHFPDAGDLNEKLINHPYEVRKLLTNVYIEAYEELFNETPNVEFIHIRNPIDCRISLSELSSAHKGKLIEFRAMIIQATKLKPRYVRGFYYCPKCGATKTLDLGFWDVPEKVGKSLTCPADGCDCKGLIFDEDLSGKVDFQEIKVQTPLQESIYANKHSTTVFYEFNKPKKAVYSGYVKIVGVPIIKKSKNGSVGELYIHAFYIEKDEEDIEEKAKNIDDKEVELINRIAKDKNVVQKLSDYAFREVSGYDMIKRAVLLQLVSSGGNIDVRTSIHILLISDPGVGKSTLMESLIQKFPFAKKVYAVTSSGPGLVGSVVREKTEFGESWVLRAGVLAETDGGVVCIDEFSRNKELYNYLLGVMEQQKIEINKAGVIDAVLPARVAILAACNPRFGRFNPDLTVWEQINLPKELLDRFDLIFVIKDKIDKKKDEDIADFSIDNYNSKVRERKGKSSGKKFVINGVELNDELLLKYVLYARQIEPEISDEARKIIKEYYVSVRKMSEAKGTFGISARQLGSIIRLAVAHAKLRLSEVVEAVDAEEAIRLVDTCLKQIAYDPESGSIDIDKIAGTPKSKRDKVEKVLGIVKELCELSENGLAFEEDIKDKAKDMGLSEKDVDDALGYLKKVGDIHSPKPGYWQLI